MLRLPSHDSIVWLVVAALAVWRVTAALVYERGPFAVMIAIRRTFVRAGLQRLVTCFHCTAVWVSALTIGVVYEWRAMTVLLVIGVAGAASIIERWLGGGVDAGEASDE